MNDYKEAKAKQEGKQEDSIKLNIQNENVIDEPNSKYFSNDTSNRLHQQ